jgi:hypothetical protein
MTVASEIGLPKWQAGRPGCQNGRPANIVPNNLPNWQNFFLCLAWNYIPIFVFDIQARYGKMPI